MSKNYLSRMWIGLVFIFLYAPLLFLVVFSFNNSRQDSIFTGFSFQWYEALTNDNSIAEGFFISLKIALLSATLATILATFAAYALVRFAKFRGKPIFTAMLNSPLVTPDVILGLSLLLFFVGAERLIGWPEKGMLTIVLGHTLLGLAYASVVIQSRLREMDRSIEEAAMDLGCYPYGVFFLVTLPNISQSLLAGWLLTFTLSFDDVVISEFLSGPGVTTLPQVIFSYARRGINPSIYAAATLLMATVILCITAYTIQNAYKNNRQNKILVS